MLIEVADTSLPSDTGEKAELYAEAGITDYWVVNLADKSIELFRDPTPSGYASRQTFKGEEPISPLAFAELSLAPSALFAAFA